MNDEKTKTTTITISKATMRELRMRALAAEMRYSDYLEKLINEAWANDSGKRSDNTNTEKIRGKKRD